MLLIYTLSTKLFSIDVVYLCLNTLTLAEWLKYTLHTYYKCLVVFIVYYYCVVYTIYYKEI